MIKKVVTYSFLAIGTYLVLYNATGSGTLINNTGTQGVNLIKAFQGR